MKPHSKAPQTSVTLLSNADPLQGPKDQSGIDPLSHVRSCLGQVQCFAAYGSPQQHLLKRSNTQNNLPQQLRSLPSEGQVGISEHATSTALGNPSPEFMTSKPEIIGQSTKDKK